MAKPDTTTTNDAREADELDEFLALLLQVPVDEREEVLEKLKAVSVNATR